MRKRSFWVLLVVGLAYLGVLGCDFAYDDLIIITGNPTIDEFSFEAIGTIFSVSYWHPHLPLDNLYRPLVILTHAIEHALVGEAPLLYHLVNLCLHLLNVYLVMRILAHLLLDRRGLVLMGGLLFGLHPVLSEAVCNVTCRADMLTTGFVLMGGLLYLRADEARKRGHLSASTIVGIALCYLAALLSKENGVVLIGVIGLLGMHRQPLGTGFGRAFGRTVARDWPLYLVLGVVLALVFAIRQAVLGHSAPATVITPPELNLLPSQPNGIRMLTAVKVLGMALWKLLVPLRLTFDYGTSQIPLSRSVLDGGFLASLLVWGGLVGVGVARYREQRFPATGLLLILGSLLPMSNLILPSTSIFNERFLYLPVVGWTLLWVWGGARSCVVRTSRRWWCSVPCRWSALRTPPERCSAPSTGATWRQSWRVRPKHRRGAPTRCSMRPREPTSARTSRPMKTTLSAPWPPSPNPPAPTTIEGSGRNSRIGPKRPGSTSRWRSPIAPTSGASRPPRSWATCTPWPASTTEPSPITSAPWRSGRMTRTCTTTSPCSTKGATKSGSSIISVKRRVCVRAALVEGAG